MSFSKGTRLQSCTKRATRSNVVMILSQKLSVPVDAGYARHIREAAWSNSSLRTARRAILDSQQRWHKHPLPTELLLHSRKCTARRTHIGDDHAVDLVRD